MIPSCPDQFWHDVAKLVAERIMLRESSLAGISLGSAVGAALAPQPRPSVVKAEPPEGPRAA